MIYLKLTKMIIYIRSIILLLLYWTITSSCTINNINNEALFKEEGLILIKYPKYKLVRSLNQILTDTEGSGGYETTHIDTHMTDITIKPFETTTISSYIENNTASTVLINTTIENESTTVMVTIANDLKSATNTTSAGSTSAAIIGGVVGGIIATGALVGGVVAASAAAATTTVAASASAAGTASTVVTGSVDTAGVASGAGQGPGMAVLTVITA